MKNLIFFKTKHSNFLIGKLNTEKISEELVLQKIKPKELVSTTFDRRDFKIQLALRTH